MRLQSVTILPFSESPQQRLEPSRFILVSPAFHRPDCSRAPIKTNEKFAVPRRSANSRGRASKRAEMKPPPSTVLSRNTIRPRWDGLAECQRRLTVIMIFQAAEWHRSVRSAPFHSGAAPACLAHGQDGRAVTPDAFGHRCSVIKACGNRAHGRNRPSHRVESEAWPIVFFDPWIIVVSSVLQRFLMYPRYWGGAPCRRIPDARSLRRFCRLAVAACAWINPFYPCQLACDQ